MNKKGFPLWLFILEVLALAAFIWHQGVRPHFRGIWIIPFLILGIGVLLYEGIRRYSLFLAAKTSAHHSRWIHSNLITLAPILLLTLVFLQHLAFLKDIRPYLLPLSAVGVLFLQMIFLNRMQLDVPWKFFAWDRLSSKQVSIRIFILIFLVFSVLASGLFFPPQPLTGDEPHYMIMSVSMLHDWDIDLFNNYQEQDYLKFYPGYLETHAYQGRKGPNHLYSKHLPGLSLLLVPAYFLGEKVVLPFLGLSEDQESARRVLAFVVRLTLCFFAAFLSMVFFKTVEDILSNRRIALLSTLLFSFLSPVLFYSHLLYPEIPAALILLLIFRYTLYKKDHRPLTLLMTGLGIALLPWLGIKYTTLAAVVFAIVAYYLLKSKSRIFPNGFVFILPMLVSACLYFFYLWTLYGNFSPSSVYMGTDPARIITPSMLFNDSFAEVFQFGIGIFFDQRIGIFVYAPIYILFLAGIYFLWKKPTNLVLALLLIFGFYWFFCSLFPYWIGYCPPGRHMLPVLWVLALFVAATLAENRNRAAGIIKSTAIGVSVAIAYLALKNPMLLYHQNLAAPPLPKGLNSNLLTSLSNAFLDLTKLVPALINQGNIRWMLLGIWIVAVALITFVLIKKRKTPGRALAPNKLGAPLAWFFVFSFLFLSYVFFDIQLDSSESFENKGYELIFQDENHFGKELDGFWTKGNRKTEVLIKSRHPLSEIKVRLTSAVAGKTAVQIDRYKGMVKRNKALGFTSMVTVPSPKGFPWEGGYLYSLQVKEANGFVPVERDRNIQDNRFLGVFVEIFTRVD